MIDTFQKWLDAFTAYMLVIVAVHPSRALELLKYQQTISKAVTKFKGLAWLHTTNSLDAALPTTSQSPGTKLILNFGQ